MELASPPNAQVEDTDTQQYLDLPAGLPVILIDTVEQLDVARTLLSEAAAVALDAEWVPGTSPPCATLLQLAVRSRGSPAAAVDSEAVDPAAADAAGGGCKSTAAARDGGQPTGAAAAAARGSSEPAAAAPAAPGVGRGGGGGGGGEEVGGALQQPGTATAAAAAAAGPNSSDAAAAAGPTCSSIHGTSSSSGHGTCTSSHGTSDAVLLLDLQALPCDETRRLLQPLFRNPNILKVGHGMRTDLRALGTALGGEGQGCVAVAAAHLDVASLHCGLLSAGVVGVRAALQPGLSGLSHAQLGLPLDKTQQCSEWGRRPLTQHQVRYAALDAYCLLLLLDSMVRLAPPADYPRHHHEGQGGHHHYQYSPGHSDNHGHRRSPQRGEGRAQRSDGGFARAEAPEVEEQEEEEEEVLLVAATRSAAAAGPAELVTGEAARAAAASWPPVSAALAGPAAGARPPPIRGHGGGITEAATSSPSAAAATPGCGPRLPAATPAAVAATITTTTPTTCARHGEAASGSSRAGGAEGFPIRRAGIDGSAAASPSSSLSPPAAAAPVEVGGFVSQGAASADLLEQAREYWAVRLDMQKQHRGGGEGGRTAANGSRLARKQLQQAAARQKLLESQVPSPLPWQLPGSDGVPRFACDVMAEGVARQLRMCGVDACSPSADAAQRHIIYRQLVEAAEADGRVILTADRFLARAQYAPAFLLQGCDRKQQLAEVLDAFDISVQRSELLSRCVRCNGPLLPNAFSAAGLPAAAASQVPVQLLERQGMQFWMCSTAGCGKVFWQGGLYQRAVGHLADRLGGCYVGSG